MPDGFALGDKAAPQLDADGTPQTRSSVLTDEGSFYDHFPGTSLGVDWTSVVGAGGSIAVADSILSIISGTTANSETYVEQEIDYLPLNAVVRLSISQRIANQDIYLELYHGTDCFMRMHFYGTNNTKVSCENQTHEGTGGNEGIDTPLTILDSLVTSNLNEYSLSPQRGKVVFGCGTSIDDRKDLVVRYRALIHLYDPLILRIRIKNGAVAPASSTTVSVDTVSVHNVNRVDVQNAFVYDALAAQLVGYDGTFNRRVGTDSAGNLKVITTVAEANDRSVYVSGTGLASTELNTDTVIPNGEKWQIVGLFFGINKSAATGSYSRVQFDGTEFARIDSNDGATRSIAINKILTGDGVKILRLVRYNTSVGTAIVTVGLAVVKL
jgi:hypothetical protein